jgi:hypothetical protein
MTTQVDPEPVEARLRAIQSITDAALSHLDDRELLAELLDRTREILSTDAAAVLPLDVSSGQLIATAWPGTSRVLRIFEITGLDHVIPHVMSLDEALAQAAGPADLARFSALRRRG